MRISDWSSDVCSSDLSDARVAGAIDRRHGDGVHPDANLDAVGHLRLIAHVHAAHRMGTAMVGCRRTRTGDRKSVVSGKGVSVRVDLGGGRIVTKKKKTNTKNTRITHKTNN